MESRKIYGAPGTGKTTRLISTVQHELENGLDITDIGYLGFTRAACTEALNRASKVAEFDNKRYYFMTIHATCLKLLMQMRLLYGKRLAVYKDMRAFCAEYKLDPPSANEDIASGGMISTGSAFFATASYLINTFRKPEEFMYSPHCDALGALDFPWLFYEWEKYKAVNGLFDFNDLLTMAQDNELVVPTSVLIIDEFQDVSPLQLEVLRGFMFEKDRIYLAGDDDQAIYGFQGADSKLMLNYTTDSIDILEHSWRCPKRIWDVAMRYIQLNSIRQPKEVEPRGPGGRVDIIRGEYISMYDVLRRIDGKKVYFLARTNYIVSKIAWKLADGGVLFRHLDSQKEKLWGWNKKRVNLMNRCISSKYPSEEFSRLAHLAGINHPIARDFLRKYCFLRQPINVKDIHTYIGTIHSAKGREADTVALFNDVTPRVIRGMGSRDGMEAERRVWYVGMTRAREQLLLVDGMFKRHMGCSTYAFN